MDIERTKRFWSKVEYSPSCWVWIAGKTKDGYGSFRASSRGMDKAHRVAYRLFWGDNPEGLVIDHKYNKFCSPSCVNPYHLRAITQKQNMENRRGAQKRSSTGIRGVYRSADGKKWRAIVGYQGKALHIGTYSSIEEAEMAAKQKRLELYTHNEADRM